MRNNSLTLLGNLGADPELRYTQGGKAVVGFRIAVWQGQNKDDFWINCTAWEDTGKLINSHFGKGDRIEVSGRLVEESWTDGQTGEVRKKFAMVVTGFGFGPPKRGEGSSGGGGSARPGGRPGQAPARPGQQQGERPPF